jgi:hypothetical protein
MSSNQPSSRKHKQFSEPSEHLGYTAPPRSPVKSSRADPDFEQMSNYRVERDLNDSRLSRGSHHSRSKHSKYTGERKLSRDQMKQKMIERLRKSREGPRKRLNSKELRLKY